LSFASIGVMIEVRGKDRVMGDYAAHPWSARLAGRIGHHSPALLSASILGVILLGLYPPQSALALTMPIALLAFVLMSWLLMRQHDRRLCELCMAAMPLNPSELAAHYKTRFWLAHSGGKPAFLVPYLAVLIGSNFLTGTIGRIGWAIVQSSMIYLILAYSSHRRLQPWCPWCREGGGGQDDRDDVTPPPPSDRRQLV
jgi:hypothetical protein